MVQKYTSLYKTDPTAEEQEAGITATSVYQGNPYALSNVPEFEVEDDQLAEVFERRGIPSAAYGGFFEGEFIP